MTQMFVQYAAAAIAAGLVLLWLAGIADIGLREARYRLSSRRARRSSRSCIRDD